MPAPRATTPLRRNAPCLRSGSSSSRASAGTRTGTHSRTGARASSRAHPWTHARSRTGPHSRPHARPACRRNLGQCHAALAGARLHRLVVLSSNFLPLFERFCLAHFLPVSASFLRRHQLAAVNRRGRILLGCRCRTARGAPGRRIACGKDVRCAKKQNRCRSGRKGMRNRTRIHEKSPKEGKCPAPQEWNNWSQLA